MRKFDLHVHSNNSDGRMSVKEIFDHADSIGLEYLSITDHDNIEGQEEAVKLATDYNFIYQTGVELNVIFSNPKVKNGKDFTLDLLGHRFIHTYKSLKDKLHTVSEYRKKRMRDIIQKLNIEFKKKPEQIELFTEIDAQNIENSADGAVGRPHIAKYLVKKNIVKSVQEAFDEYLVICDVPKYRFPIEEAIKLLHDAGAFAILAHPNDPHGTSLAKITPNLEEQVDIIKKYLLDMGLDGIECWHSRHDKETSLFYHDFALKNELLISAGSDCHQNPTRMGKLNIPLDKQEEIYIFKQNLPISD